MHMGISFFKKKDLRDFRDLICISLDLTKKLEQFLDLRDLVCMVTYFFKKLFKSWDLRDLRDLICMAIYFFFFFFFLKIWFNLGTFGTLGTSYFSLYVLLNRRNTSRDLGEVQDLIYMAIFFKKELFESRDYHDLRTSYVSL